MTNLYNQIYRAPNGTLLGNWFEEQRLRDYTSSSKYIKY